MTTGYSPAAGQACRARGQYALARTAGRTRALGVPLPLPQDPITPAEVGEGIVALVARAQASGIDADQAVRDALRALERRIVEAEQAASRG